jgi:hypothetical protein
MNDCFRRGLVVVAVLLLTGAGAANAAAARRKVIIDQDAFGPGGPNLQPILLVLQSPDVEVLGITVESGDGWLKENLRTRSVCWKSSGGPTSRSSRARRFRS